MAASRFERHPWLTLAAVTLLGLLVLAFAAEVVVRLVGGYDPFQMNFYSKHSDKSAGVYETPYGDLRINDFGFPDVEFDLDDPRPRVGYFGDSVTFGLGAGQGYRISDHLRRAFPAYQHMTFGKVGGGLQVKEVALALELTDRFAVDRYVYLMNLNDIVPSIEEPGRDRTPLLRRMRYSRAFVLLDQLRMHSHFYNFVRTRVRNVIAQRGFRLSGFQAHELWPQRDVHIIDELTARINELNRELRSRGVTYCIALLPYEMQISSEAARYYESLGFSWEEGFLEGSTQRMVEERLDPDIRVVDTYGAFVGGGSGARTRDDNGLGAFFIARSGGAVDWDHPNRAGHRAIADFLIAQDFCGLGDAAVASGPAS